MTKFALAICAFAFTLSFSSPSSSKESYLAYSTMTLNNTALWVPRDMGFLKKHGIDATLVYVQGGGVLVQGMLRGFIDRVFGKKL
ncbi:MAG: hypothetical protein FJ145_13600 [Deltaproteobacteria bacterium]|nr:hypothetical protein [Deltaproteobacteria bacterium]